MVMIMTLSSFLQDIVLQLLEGIIETDNDQAILSPFYHK